MNKQVNSHAEQWILKSIQILPVALMLTFTLVVTLVLVNEERRRTQDLLNGLRDDFVASQRAAIQSQISNVYHQIQYEKNQTITLLKEDIKSRVQEAYEIVDGIYKANPNRPKAQVVHLIRQALFNVRFNEGRGYYFIWV